MTELELAGSPSARWQTRAFLQSFGSEALKNYCTQRGLGSSKSLTDDSKGDEGVECVCGGGGCLTFSSSLTFGLFSGPKKISDGAFETMI